VRTVARAILVVGPVAVMRAVRVILGTLLRVLAVLTRPAAALFDRLLDGVTAAYPRVLEGALRHRVLVVLVALAAFAGSLALVPGLGVDLIPPFAQGEFSFRVELPEGTPLEVTDRYLAEVGQVLVDEPAVQSFSSIAGGAGLSLASTGAEGENTGRLQVRLTPGSDPGQEELVAAGLRSRLARSEMAEFKFERATYFSFRTPIEVEVYADSLVELHEAAAQITERLDRVPGLVDVRTSAQLGNPEVQIRFRREQLARLGLQLAAVADTVRDKVQGEVATRFTEGDREIDIRVRAMDRSAARVADIHDVIVGHSGGRPIFLKSVADIEITEGPTEIRRIGQKRAALVNGNLSGRDMGAVAGDVRAALGELALPAGVTATLSGQEEELQRSFRSLSLAAALAVFLVYLVMASQFESLLHPLVIIFTLPLGAIGVIGALAITGHTVNVVAIIGAVMLAGIVVNNAIVLVDAVNQRRRAGAAVVEALLEAGQSRLRPILMTSATTIFGLAPMALGLGEGAELRTPLAITVIGGLAVATALTLVVIPVVYSFFARESLQLATEPEAAAELAGEVS
jgi:HAE1 family hydrophobic/amphiphilic exporter-1